MKAKIYGSLDLPRYVIGVYVGYDEPKSIGFRETGSSVALPIFKTILENYLYLITTKMTNL